MTAITNSEVTKQLLKTLIEKISRRTSESFAVVTLHTLLKVLQKEHGFLRYLEVNTTLYSEGLDAVHVNQAIDTVEPEEFYKGIYALINMTVKYLKKNADFFFIKEFQEAISAIPGMNLKGEGIDLSHMQFEYLVKRKQDLQTEYVELVENVLRTLVCLLNRTYPEREAMAKLKGILDTLSMKHSFLHVITIGETPDKDGFYTINVPREINTILSVGIAKALQELIEKVSAVIEWKEEKTFQDVFKQELGERHVLRLKQIGVDLKEIMTVSQQKENQQLMEKTMNALITILGKRTSESFAVASIDKIIQNLKEHHQVLSYVTIDDTHYSKGFEAIQIMNDVNQEKPYKVAQAIRDMIKLGGMYLGRNTQMFIEDFKKQLGDEYLSELGRIGVNLHFLELKFM
jgi:hypothetical protein